MLMKLIMIAFGGAIGALARYGTGMIAIRTLGDKFVFGTLIVNVTGCFLLGLIMHDYVREAPWLGDSRHAGLSVGFLGALTTFSTFGYETLVYWQNGKTGLAMINIGANLVLGLAAAAAGMSLGQRLGT